MQSNSDDKTGLHSLGGPEQFQRAHRLHEMAVNLFAGSEIKSKEVALKAAKLLLESVALHATPQSLLNLAKLYMVANMQEMAIDWGMKCLSLCSHLSMNGQEGSAAQVKPNPYQEVSLAMHRLLGQAYAHLAQYELALPHLKAYHLAQPIDAANQFDLAYTLLALGQYEEGWAHYLVRYRPGFTVSGAKDLPKLPIPEWDGNAASLKGKTIVLVPEQGFGDEIHFARVARNLRDLGARVWIMAQPPLQSLMRTLPWKERVVGTDWMGFKEADLWSTSLKAYALLKLNPFKEPPCCPYLMSDPSRLTELEQVLNTSSAKNLKSLDESSQTQNLIGINWRGNAKHFNDTARSMSLEELLENVRAEREIQFGKTRLVSIQMQPTQHELSVLAEQGIQNIAPHIANFTDLAAALSCLTHLFTVDSAPAHLAGALSLPTTLLVPPRIDWRWGTPASRTPWYPSLKVKLQEKHLVKHQAKL